MASRDVLIRGGRVIDPAANRDEIADVLIRAEKIEAVGDSLGAPDGAEIIDAAGQVVAPGLVDPHCHLRQPGFEYKETIGSGSLAAAAGGYTTICSMANTEPVADARAVIETILEFAERDAVIRVLPLASVTVGMQGRQLVQMGELSDAGAIGFSDDGIPLSSTHTMRTALEYATRFGRPVANHAEDAELIAGAAMHEGLTSARLGLPAAPRQAEEIMIGRDVLLSELTGGSYYALHLSSGGSVELIRRAKERGAPVRAEVTPHHLTLTDAIVGGRSEPDTARLQPYDANTKVNPPLREQSDLDLLREGLASGVIDCVGSDHAPHARHEKEVEYAQAASGFSCFETAFATMLFLVHDGVLDLPTLIERMTAAPCRVYGLPYGSLSNGAEADVVIFDPDLEWTVDREQFLSKGKNTPFHGLPMKGRVTRTIFGGATVFDLTAAAAPVSGSVGY
jgi:dihydroorotase